MYVVGAMKISIALVLLIGVWIPMPVFYAAFSLAVLMAGALAMHAKVRDPLKKSMPAATMLALCLMVAF